MKRTYSDPEKGHRTHTVSSRFSEKEIIKLDAMRGKMRRGEFIRRLVLGKKLPKKIPEANLKIYQETARIAANLNQISHKINIEGWAGNVDLEECERVLSDLRKSLLDLKGGFVADET